MWPGDERFAPDEPQEVLPHASLKPSRSGVTLSQIPPPTSPRNYSHRSAGRVPEAPKRGGENQSAENGAEERARVGAPWGSLPVVLDPAQEPYGERSEARIRPWMATCRFCRHQSGATGAQTHEAPTRTSRAYELGYEVCQCEGLFGYAHCSCFYRYLARKARRSCPYCRTQWKVDPEELSPFLARKRRLRAYGLCLFLTNAVLGLVSLVLLVVVVAYLCKGLVYAATGTPEYWIGPLPVRAEPSPGDLAVGAILLASLSVLYAVHRACMACVPCYRRGCNAPRDLLRRRPGKGRAYSPVLYGDRPPLYHDREDVELQSLAGSMAQSRAPYSRSTSHSSHRGPRRLRAASRSASSSTTPSSSSSSLSHSDSASLAVSAERTPGGLPTSEEDLERQAREIMASKQRRTTSSPGTKAVPAAEDDHTRAEPARAPSLPPVGDDRPKIGSGQRALRLAPGPPSSGH